MVFSLTEDSNTGRPDNSLTPVFIGLTVTSIIGLIALLTQAGINPARDFGPRMVAWIFGWKEIAFPDHYGGFFFVYILAPLIGGAVAAFFYVGIVGPAMKNSTGECNCNTDDFQY